MKPFWLPDWTDPNNYPDPTNTSRLEWAWQFLRRNQEYQRLWAKLIKPHYDPALVDASLARADREAGFRSVSNRPRLPEELELDEFLQGFGIYTVPPDPSEPRAKLRFKSTRFAQSGRRGTAPGWVYKITTTLDDDEVLIWFDLDRPIETQLKKAKELLTRSAAKKGHRQFRFRPEQYAKYLRLLDAKAVDARSSNIAKLIYPRVKNTYPDYEGKRRVRDELKIAERLRDRDFRRIAAGGE